MKPLIVISATSGEDKNRPYIETIEAHGGRTAMVQPGDHFISLNPQGFLLTGGGDLSECFYDHSLSESERKTLGRVEPDREAHERQILTWAQENDIPTLGICRGFQMINAFAQGKLIPDIPTWQSSFQISPILNHRPEGDSSNPAHPLELETKSQLYQILESHQKIDVNSSHHQALSCCGNGLKITARAPDGIIEAVEDPSKTFWLGVQFHPERMWKRFPIFSNLFRRFTELAQQKAQ